MSVWRQFPYGWTHPTKTEEAPDNLFHMWDKKASIPATGGEVASGDGERWFEFFIEERPEHAYVPAHIGYRIPSGSYIKDFKAEVLESWTPGLGALICAMLDEAGNWHQLGFTWNRNKGSVFTNTGAGTGTVPVPFSGYIYFNLAPFNANVNGNGKLKVTFKLREM